MVNLVEAGAPAPTGIPSRELDHHPVGQPMPYALAAIVTRAHGTMKGEPDRTAGRTAGEAERVAVRVLERAHVRYSVSRPSQAGSAPARAGQMREKVQEPRARLV